jgi:peptide/nickel transport system permease protein
MRSAGDPIATMGGRRATRPEDRERLARLLGLDKPVYVQYLYWLIGNDWARIDVDGDGVPETPGDRLGVLRGEFGNSLVSRGKPVWDIIWERLPNTLILMIPAEVIVILLSLAIGIYSALRQYSVMDHVVTALSFVGYSMPIFFIALMSMYIFAVNFKRWGLPYLPTVGMFDPQVGKTPGQVLLHMILPIFSMTVITAAGYSRYVRSQMLEVIGEDYIRTARAKGLPPHRVLLGHGLRNALLPVITLLGLQLGALLAGAVVTETVFSWPGIGLLTIEAIQTRDYPVVQACVLLISLTYVFVNLLTDLAYAWVDPRIRLGAAA